MADFTVVALETVEDSAPALGADGQVTRFAGGPLEAERTGLTHLRIHPDRRSIRHRHEAAEEVYVVLAGSGRMRLDGATVELHPRDAIRVSPAVMRGFEAGPDGLEVLAVGARVDGDGELVPGWWDD